MSNFLLEGLLLLFINCKLIFLSCFLNFLATDRKECELPVARLKIPLDLFPEILKIKSDIKRKRAIY